MTASRHDHRAGFPSADRFGAPARSSCRKVSPKPGNKLFSFIILNFYRFFNANPPPAVCDFFIYHLNTIFMRFMVYFILGCMTGGSITEAIRQNSFKPDLPIAYFDELQMICLKQ